MSVTQVFLQFLSIGKEIYMINNKLQYKDLFNKTKNTEVNTFALNYANKRMEEDFHLHFNRKTQTWEKMLATEPLSEEQYDLLEKMGPQETGKTIWSFIDNVNA